MTLQLLLEAPRATDPAGHAAFHQRVLKARVPRLEALGPRRLRVALTEAPPPRLAAVPFMRSAAALFTVDLGPGAKAAAVLAALAPAPEEQLGAWRVDAAAPREQERRWALGARSPGVGLLSVFRRRPGLDHATFLRRWHGSHTPLTLAVHPVVAYHRCVARTPLKPSPDIDGIVEERFGRRADLTDPRRFYGGAWAMVPNALRVAWDIATFLDVRAVRSWFVAERRIVEPLAPR